MIKKPLGLLLTGVLTFGLAACNNNNNDAADEVRTSRANRDNTYLNVGNNRDDGIDHNGPLTEDYTNNDNNDPDWDRNTNNRNNNDDYITNVNNDRNRTNNRYNRTTDRGINTNNVHYNPLSRNNDRDFINVRNNNNTNKNNNNMNDALNISADRTTLDSKNYPHTKAILIQHAQYRYIPFGSVQWFQFGGQQGRTPTQQQGPTTEVPNQQQGPAVPAPVAPTAPAPAPAAPAPAAPTPAPAAPAPKPAAPAPATGDVSAYVKQVIDLTNAQRSKNGLPALKHDTQLSGVAQKKSVDMAQNNYFSHTSPTYGSPFDMMRDFGVTYKSAGENIAQGQRTPQEVVNAWMNSEGHRKNILSANFTHIGVGYEKSGNHWTQMFIGK
ncbi:CAP domain-containing protein [Neobacillus sp. 3P2-tot-E-2]